MTVFRKLSWYFFPVVLVSLQGCYPFAKIPVDSHQYTVNPMAQSSCLFVFLPGRDDRYWDFARHGFIEEVRRTGLPMDMLAVDLHFGYYREGSALLRLNEDVVQPAREKGYRNIWLIGISAGGLASLAYSIQNPGKITGMVLLGPFLGENEIIEEIKYSGGVLKWNPDRTPDNDYERQLWRGVREFALGKKKAPFIYLGYGKSDRLAESQTLLASVLPGNHVFVYEGGHDWKTWKALWNVILVKLEKETSSCASALAREDTHAEH
jgi:hypothetical protein